MHSLLINDNWTSPLEIKIMMHGMNERKPITKKKKKLHMFITYPYLQWWYICWNCCCCRRGSIWLLIDDISDDDSDGGSSNGQRWRWQNVVWRFVCIRVICMSPRTVQTCRWMSRDASYISKKRVDDEVTPYHIVGILLLFFVIQFLMLHSSWQPSKWKKLE